VHQLLRTLPYIRAWANTYSDKGLVVIGVHTPSSASSTTSTTFGARCAPWASSTRWPSTTTTRCGTRSATSTGRALHRRAEGRVRHHEFGEGGYDKSERVIRQLLTDAGAVDLRRGRSGGGQRHRSGRDWSDVRSPETYVGLARSSGFASRGGAAFDEARSTRCRAPAPQRVGLVGAGRSAARRRPATTPTAASRIGSTRVTCT